MGREKLSRPLLPSKALGATYTRILGLLLTDLRVFDAAKTFLPNSPSSDDLGLAAAAGSPVLSTAASGDVVGQKLGFDFVLPPDYKAGGAVTLRVRAKLGGALQVSGTIDAIAKVISAGALGSDICATAAQNLATDNAFADYDFTLTPTSLSPGSRVNVVVAIDLDDTGGTANKFATISEVSIRYLGIEGGQ